jgi:hypothetical protein
MGPSILTPIKQISGSTPSTAGRNLSFQNVNSGCPVPLRPLDQLALLFIGTLTLLHVQHWGSAGALPALEELPSLAVSAFLDGTGG